MKDIQDVINKIKKLMAIANDPSASDQEIQLASYRAEKLMLKYKIDNKEIIENTKRTENDVIHFAFDKQYTGYIIWTLNCICEQNQCIACYNGKINSKVILKIIGFEDDVEITKTIAIPIVNYMEQTLEDLKECYIGYEDFRVFKRSWCDGFAVGIKQQLNNALIEMKSDEKFELTIIDLHPVLKSYEEKHIVSKRNHFQRNSYDAYKMGLAEGSKYNLQDNNKQKHIDLNIRSSSYE